MPVPSAISDLSKVASENSPAGTETAKGTIDDYLRAGFAFIRQLSDLAQGPTVTLPSAATVNIGFAGSQSIAITGTTTITAFDNTAEGAMRWVTFAGALVLTHNPAGLQLPGGANITTIAGDVAVFKSLGSGNWKCMGYQRIGGTGPVVANATRDGYLSAADWSAFNGKQAALGYTPMSTAGGTFSGDVIYNNDKGIYGKTTNGNVGPMLYTKTDNWTYFGNVAGIGWRWANSVGAVVASLTEAGDLTSRSHTSTSDQRLKKKWRRGPADLLQRVARLRKLGSFLWKKDGTPGIGGSAQEFEDIWPEAVHTDAYGFKSFNYGPAAFVIAVELTRAFFAYVAKTDKRLVKLEGE